MSEVAGDLAKVFRAESGRILASLMMSTRSVELAEDALADALLQAAEQWPVTGTPKNRAAWLLTVARRRAIDRLRKEAHRNADVTRQAILDTWPETDELSENGALIPDERLRLIFTCCHPALAEEARVPLTLKTLCGLSTREIARSFLTSETTMNQRLTRAKRKIRDAGIAYEVPEGEALNERLPSVLSVLYLIYNESYNAFEGHSLSRINLADEAIRLARILHNLLPRPDVAGLLALMLLHDSRKTARSSVAQPFIPLEQQDRLLWNQTSIREGTKILLTAMGEGKPDTYQLQAAISAVHAMATVWDATDWTQIQHLYSLLYQLNPSPVVALNQAVASAYAGHVSAAYARLNELEEELVTYQPFYAARAEFGAKLGLEAAAHEDYNMAISLSKNAAEKNFLRARKKRLEHTDACS